MLPTDWDISAAMTALAAAISASGRTVEEVFADLDSDDDGRLNGPELLAGLSDLLGEAMDPLKVSEVITSFDENADHRIDPDEWKALVEQHGEEE